MCTAVIQFVRKFGGEVVIAAATTRILRFVLDYLLVMVWTI
jgi:hypothetical protein